MNEKVAKLINDEKVRLSVLEKERCDEHLISLGLIDEPKINMIEGICILLAVK